MTTNPSLALEAEQMALSAGVPFNLRGVTPDIAAYNGVLDGCANRGDLDTQRQQ